MRKNICVSTESQFSKSSSDWAPGEVLMQAARECNKQLFVSKNKMQLKCPMCPSKVVHLRHHLRSQHKIKNPEERQIMLRLARGRVRLHDIKCPVCSINYINIKRHIRLGHWELTPKQVKTFIKELHLKVSIDQLRKLCLVVSAG